MRATLLMAVALTAVAACDMPQDAALRFDLSEDYYEAAGLGEIGRKFRREAPFFVDLADGSALSPEAMARLDAQADWIAGYPAMRLLVVAMGPADGAVVPAADPSHGRAETVLRYLVAQGVAPDMIRARVTPAGPSGADFDPLLRVTTFIEEGTRDPSGGLPALIGGLDATAPDAVPALGGTTSDGPASGAPAAGVPAAVAPAASDPAPSGPGGRNAAKREANSGRGNGDEAGDPGKSGGRNQGGDEA